MANVDISGRLHSIATGNVVAGANEILDDDLSKKQSQINAETYGYVQSINDALEGLSPEQQEALSVSSKANNNEAKLGYYVCTTEGNIAAKTIAAPNYILSLGGNIKIKMVHANSASGATLNINSTGPKTLLYNGEPVSSNNTWEDNDVISVYYDGTRYMASNSQGGGKADSQLDENSTLPVQNKVVTQAINTISENLQMLEEQFATTTPLWSVSNVQIKNKTTYLATTAIGFEVGKTYKIRIELASALSANAGFYLAPNANSTTGNKWLASVVAGSTSDETIYTPDANSNYQYLYSYNNSPATTGNITIEEISEIDLQSTQEEIDLLNLVPDYIVTNPVFIALGAYTRQVGALGGSQKWTTGAGASHVAIPVNAGDNFILAGDTTNAWGWVTSSYNPPYSNNNPIPYVTGYDRRFSGLATIQTAPEGAAYLIVGVVNGAGTAGKWQIVKVDSYTRRKNDSFVKFKFASWNIGRFVYYNYKTTHQTSDISDADADRIALEYRQIIDKTGANIFGICEYEPKYPRYNSSGNTKDILFSCFKQAREGQRLKAAFCNALFMNSPQYISMSEKVFDHIVSGQPRYYIDVLCKIGGKEVHVVETHLEWTDDSTRALQIEELIDTMSVYPYVIIAGDLNTDANTIETEMQPFIDAGYAVANGGYIGSFVTHEDNYKLDNIVAKGFAMSNIKVDENAGNYSDHWIISCDMEML